MVIVLSPEGSILRQGPYDDNGLRDLDVLVCRPPQSSDDDSPAELRPARKVTRVISSKTNLDMARQIGDLSLYKYYAKFIGWYGGAIFLSFQAAHIFCETFPRMYLMLTLLTSLVVLCLITNYDMLYRGLAYVVGGSQWRPGCQVYHCLRGFLLLTAVGSGSSDVVCLPTSCLRYSLMQLRSVLVWIAPRSARKLHWVLLRTVMR